MTDTIVRADPIDHGIVRWCRSYTQDSTFFRTGLCVLPLGHEPPCDYREPDEAHEIRGTTPAVRSEPDTRCTWTKRETWDMPGLGKKLVLFRCAWSDPHPGLDHLFPVFPDRDPVLSRD